MPGRRWWGISSLSHTVLQQWFSLFKTTSKRKCNPTLTLTSFVASAVSVLKLQHVLTQSATITINIWESHIMTLGKRRQMRHSIGWQKPPVSTSVTFISGNNNDKRIEASMEKASLSYCSSLSFSSSAVDRAALSAGIRLSWMEETLGEAVLIQPTISHKALHSP